MQARENSLDTLERSEKKGEQAVAFSLKILLAMGALSGVLELASFLHLHFFLAFSFLFPTGLFLALLLFPRALGWNSDCYCGILSLLRIFHVFALFLFFFFPF